MYLFLSALGSEKLLKPDSWELIFTPHSLPSEVPEGAWPPPHQDPYGYGFGLMPVKADGKTYTMVGHGGAGYGSNYAGRILGTKKVIVIYNNMMKNPILTDVFQYVASQ
jgi:CubicO group peptidase (beta-lactamase class C family)